WSNRFFEFLRKCAEVGEARLTLARAAVGRRNSVKAQTRRSPGSGVQFFASLEISDCPEPTASSPLPVYGQGACIGQRGLAPEMHPSKAAMEGTTQIQRAKVLERSRNREGRSPTGARGRGPDFNLQQNS